MITINNRTLGLGFVDGYEFNLFIKEEVYKPFVNELEKIEDMRKAIFSNSLNNQVLAKHLPDLLVDLDLTRLVKILPKIIGGLSDENRQVFSDKKILEKIDKRFLKTIAESLPEKQQPKDVDGWSQLLSKADLARLDPFVLAYLVPAILDQMENSDLVRIAAEITRGLAEKDFKAITVPNYFDIEFFDTSTSLTLKNNGRSLIFKPDAQTKSTAIFRDKIWELDHTHIHFEKDNEQREYKFYQTRAEYEQTKNTENDPNLQIVGEVHSVFKRLSGKNKDKDKYMAIGIPMQLGAVNADFKNILDHISRIEKIEYAQGLEVPIQINFRDVFMKNFSSNEMLYHSWGSLNSTTHAFRAGLRFNIIKKPLEISIEQYHLLKTLFGELQTLDPEKMLYPIDRKADSRKIRQL